jgi:hypothetical protein
MSRFQNLLEQEYLKLDIKEHELNELQKNVVDKMLSSGKATYDGIQKMNAVVSYDMDGKSGKIKIDPSGKISKHSEKSEGEDEENAEEYKTSMTDDDLGVVRKLMSNQDKKVVDTAVKGTVNAFVGKLNQINQRLSKIK